MIAHEELTRRFGTPLYVYDLEQVRAGRDQLFASLPPGFCVYYALKANPHPDIAMAVRESAPGPVGAEISSVGELAAALEAGFAPHEILYTGPGKTSEEVMTCLDAGVTHFSIESMGDFHRIAELARMTGRVAEAMLRVNQTATGSGSGIQMMGRPSQFGIDAETLPEIAETLRTTAGIRVVGTHFYAGSNVVEEDALVEEFRRAARLAYELRETYGLAMELVDLGGGFSSPYTRRGERTAYPKLATRLAAMLDEEFAGWRDGSTRFAVESGRYIVGESGTLLTRVTNIKDSRGKRFVIVDAGVNTLGGLSGLNRLLPMSVETLQEGEPDHVASLVGPLCTPGDWLTRDTALPPLVEGDLVAIPNVGAYGPTASLLGFLGRPAPTEVLVEGETVVSCSRIELARRATIVDQPSVAVPAHLRLVRS